jgi:hypothetical protein
MVAIGTVAGSYSFGILFLSFESIDILIPTFKWRIFMTIAGSYILQSWQLQLVLTVEFCIQV